MGYLYLRDLKEEMQIEFLDRWKKEHRRDLIKSHEQDLDIEVGDYFEDHKDEKVVR